MSVSESTTPVRKFHLSLSVSDLTRSVAFYQILFGQPPAKLRPDYAKFELSEPPTVFSLIPAPVSPGGNLNHMGLCLLSSEELVAIQDRLERAGHRTLREDGVECCYAKQTKFWVRDPDGALLELYVFHEDMEDHGSSHVPGDELPHVMGGGAASQESIPTWTHHLGQAVVLPLSQEAHSIQEVLLEGSLNDSLDLTALLKEVLRILRPGGSVTLHGLAGDRPLCGPTPSLPGPAAAVKEVPDYPAVLASVRAAGFASIQVQKLSEKGYFEAEGVPLREVLIRAVKPGFRPAKKSQTVVYTGPEAAVEDDFGNRFPKGTPVSINIHDWQVLQRSPSSSQFIQLSETLADTGCQKPA